MDRSEAVTAQINCQTVYYKGKPYLIRHITSPEIIPSMVYIGQTKTTIWRNTGEVVGDPRPLRVNVTEVHLTNYL